MITGLIFEILCMHHKTCSKMSAGEEHDEDICLQPLNCCVLIRLYYSGSWFSNSGERAAIRKQPIPPTFRDDWNSLHIPIDSMTVSSLDSVSSFSPVKYSVVATGYTGSTCKVVNAIYIRRTPIHCNNRFVSLQWVQIPARTHSMSLRWGQMEEVK